MLTASLGDKLYMPAPAAVNSRKKFGIHATGYFACSFMICKLKGKRESYFILPRKQFFIKVFYPV